MRAVHYELTKNNFLFGIIVSNKPVEIIIYLFPFFNALPPGCVFSTVIDGRWMPLLFRAGAWPAQIRADNNLECK